MRKMYKFLLGFTYKNMQLILKIYITMNEYTKEFNTL